MDMNLVSLVGNLHNPGRDRRDERPVASAPNKRRRVGRLIAVVSVLLTVVGL